MSPDVSGAAFALFSIGCAFLVCRFMLFRGRITVYFVCWGAFAICIFFVHNPVVFLFLVTAIIAGAVIHHRSSVSLFTAIFPAVPPTMGMMIPFPGLNYLLILNYARLAIIALLAPVSIATLGSPRARGNRAVATDRLVFLLFAIVVLLGFRGTSFTDALRSGFYTTLVMILPYLAFSRTITNKAGLIEIMKAFVVLSVILCFILFMVQLKRWDFYPFGARILDASPSRFGHSGAVGTFMGPLVRADVTLNSQLMAFVFTAAALFLEYMRIPLRMRTRSVRVVQLLLLVGTIATTGRGGWLGALVAVLAYGVLTTRNRALTAIAWAGIIFISGFLAFALLNHGNLYFLDPRGTFKYRVDLIFNSFDAISQNPIFGSSTYLTNEALQASRQGQGIIDVVNAYLGIALQYGLVTAAIYVSMFAVTMRGLLKTAKRLKRLRARDEENLCYLMVSILLGYMAFLGTISTVSLIEHYIYIFLGLSVGTLRLAQATVRQVRRDKAEAAAEKPDVSMGRGLPNPATRVRMLP